MPRAGIAYLDGLFAGKLVRTLRVPAGGSTRYRGDVDQSLRVAIRVKPSAKRDRVGGGWDGQFGHALVVAVRAPAVDGKANEAACAALAKALSVRPRDVTIVRGVRGRDKLVEIRDAPACTDELVHSLS